MATPNTCPGRSARRCERVPTRRRGGRYLVRVSLTWREMKLYWCARLEAASLTPSAAALAGLEINRDGRRRSGFEMLAYPGIDFQRLVQIWPNMADIAPAIAEQISVDAKYASYVDRQTIDIATLKRDEGIKIPLDFEFGDVIGLSNEVRAKLNKHRPTTLAQAGQIDGMTPAALMLVLAQLRKGGRKVAAG